MLRSAILFFVAAAAAQTATPTSSGHVTSTASSGLTAVSDCHMHGATQFCFAGTTEFAVLATATGTESLPASYTGCHAHGSETFCFSPSGGEVQLEVEGSESHDESDHDLSNSTSAAAASSASASATGTSSSGSGKNCHFHAGVEHCIDEGESESAQSCERVDRDYNIPLRIGLLFVMLVTSCIGVLGPIILTSWFRLNSLGLTFVVLRQFGTGVIISTAFVHLFTHASLMFSNPCIGELSYEATTAAILIAGLFVSFLVEYGGYRFVQARNVLPKATTSRETESMGKVEEQQTLQPDRSPSSDLSNQTLHHQSDALRTLILEAGIIFHSLLIGLTLVVAGDSFFLTLFAVIVFHQMFEGIALGTLIAALKSTSLMKKLMMATAFAIITPISMGIGIGVVKHFNGNDRATLIAIGTLDAFSAGILVWVGLVEMWAKDWIHGPLAKSNAVTTILALVSLMFGVGVMSLLGKWA